MHKQKAYKLVDDAFRSFFINNKKMLRGLIESEMYDLAKLDHNPVTKKDRYLCGRQILESPYNARYMGKGFCGDGMLYVFLNAEFEELYRYLDVG